MTNPASAGPATRVVTQREAAAILSLSVPTLNRYRSHGNGPRFVRLGERRIGYRMADLDAWLASRVEGGGQRAAS